jgi:hypothetical protein
VSTFVGVLMLVTGLVVVLALLVVRRRHRTPVTIAVALVTVVAFAAGGLFLIVPPQVPSAQSSDQLASCPYDRLVWSNMRDDVDESWQPCRRVARIQLTMALVGASLVTLMAAAMAVKEPEVDAVPELEVRG